MKYFVFSPNWKSAVLFMIVPVSIPSFVQPSLLREKRVCKCMNENLLLQNTNLRKITFICIEILIILRGSF